MNSYTLRLYHGAPTLHLTWRSVFFVCKSAMFSCICLHVCEQGSICIV